MQLYKFFGNAFFIFNVFSYRETSILSSLCCPIEKDEDGEAATYQAAKNGDNLPMFQFLLAPVESPIVAARHRRRAFGSPGT